MPAKLNNEIIDKRLIDNNRSIKRLGEYINNSTKIQFLCLVDNCGNIWLARPGNILYKGCPVCGGSLKLSNEIVDNRLLNKNRPIKRIGNYINANTKIDWKCLEDNCNVIWKGIPSEILNKKKKGCPVCSDRTLNNKIIDDRLLNRSIRRLGNYISTSIKIDWKCLIENCNTIWSAIPAGIIRKNKPTGCPACANIAFNNTIVDEKLKNNNRHIKRVGEYINISTKIYWQCLLDNCKHIWEAEPNTILNHNTGCPLCKNKNEKLIFNLLKNNNIEFEFQKPIKELNSNETKKYTIDFYFPKYKLAVEYNGRQHYELCGFGSLNILKNENKLIKQQKRDQYVRDFCILNKIKLLEIDGRIFYSSRLDKSIEEILIPYLNNIGDK